MNTGSKRTAAWRRIALVLMLCALCATSRPARAQPPSPPDGFVPASSLPSQEQLPAAPLVIGAYAVAWVLVFGYLWSIWRRLERLETELADVRRRVSAGPSR